MNTSVISNQGQITIPAAIRRELGLKPNQELSWQVVKSAAGVKYLHVSAPSPQVIKSLKGISKKYPKGYLEKERASWE